MSNKNLADILNFLQKSEGLKSLMRHSWLSSGRRESVAEHSWRAALFAILLADSLESKIDIGKVVEMLIVHDLAEIIAGDHKAWKGKLEDKAKIERKALLALTKSLPLKQKHKIVNLWEEYEAKKTVEGKFAKAIDKLETIDQHNLADLKTWNKREYTYNLEHGEKETDFSKNLKSLKKLIDNQTRAKTSKLNQALS